MYVLFDFVMDLVVAPLLEGGPKYVGCITLAGLEPIGANKDWCGQVYSYIAIGIKVASRSGSVQGRVGSVGSGSVARVGARFASLRPPIPNRFALSPMNAKVWQIMLRSSFDSLKVRFGSLRLLSGCQGLLTAHAAYCYCSPPPLLFLRIRSECLWSTCLTSFDDDLQSQADQRPFKYKTPGLQSSDTSPRTHLS